MRERLRNPLLLLQIVCGILGLLLLGQLLAAASAADPLAGLDAAADGPGAAADPPPAAGPASASELPARFRPIADRKIFGVVPPRPPLPVLLEGIGYDFAFVRSAKGRSGMLRVGETLDGVKLLEIGVNRVVVELDGEQQELVMHQGLGGMTLLPVGPKTGKTEKAAAPPRPVPGPEKPKGEPR